LPPLLFLNDFQSFFTVNTASRIETTGKKNRIHISEETAALLRAVGKECWVEPRTDSVHAKGKGEENVKQEFNLSIALVACLTDPIVSGLAGDLQTYWLKNAAGNSASAFSSVNDSDHQASIDRESLNEKHARLVKWISEILASFLKQIVAKRKKIENASQIRRPASTIGRKHSLCNGGVLEELQDVIELPKFDEKSCVTDKETRPLNPEVASELYEYVYSVASMYCTNVSVGCVQIDTNAADSGAAAHAVLPCSSSWSAAFSQL
jgi:Adenylate and Guanylate cyclase catalytic domain